MSDIYNPKVRVKYLRSSTLNELPINPGNILYDMDDGKIYVDVLNSDNSTQRIRLTGSTTWKGTVPTYNDLPTNPTNGDIYNVADTGANYIWSEFEQQWDKFSEDLSIFYTKSEIDNKFITVENIDYLTNMLNNTP